MKMWMEKISAEPLILSFQSKVSSHLCDNGAYLEGQSWGYDWRAPSGIPAMYHESEGD